MLKLDLILQIKNQIDHCLKEKNDLSKDEKAISAKLKFKNYKNCLEAVQLQNKINYLNYIKS